VISFQEFLHGDGWTKPLQPDLDKAIRKVVRDNQQANAKLRGATVIPDHQKLMLALAQAGQRGLTRAEIGGLVDLDAKVLEELLAALVRSTEIGIVQRTDGQRVFRRQI
jgi:hypothetical protein